MSDVLAQMGGLSPVAWELGLSEQQAASGADGAQQPASGGGLGGLLGGLLGRAGAAGPLVDSMLDMQGDGNPLDDNLKMAVKALG